MPAERALFLAVATLVLLFVVEGKPGGGESAAATGQHHPRHGQEAGGMDTLHVWRGADVCVRQCVGI